MEIEDKTILTSLVLGFGTLYIAAQVYNAWNTRYILRNIPAVGRSGIFSSYLGAMRYLKDPPGMIQEGYQNYRGHAFKLPMMTRWVVVVSGRDRVDEICRAADDVLSIREATNELLQAEYTLGTEIALDRWHATTARTHMTRNLGARFLDVQDEIAASFAEHLPATDEWSSVLALHAILEITCRTSNRLFVGLPICRNSGYRKLNIDFTMDLITSSQIIGIVPQLLRPAVGRALTKVPRSVNQGLEYLGPMIRERLEQDTELGKDWEERPNDLISWLLDTAPESEKNPRSLVLRVLVMNMAAIHTTSMTFTQVLFDLANHPEYISALREEIEHVAQSEGLTEVSMRKLVKVDSFIKESQRLQGILALTLQRKSLKDFTFSDGLVIPKGSYLTVANKSMHQDEEYYKNAEIFDGYRFVKMGGENNEFNKHSMSTLRTDYLTFGHGRHACPGRFFAVNEIKAFVAHLLINYDILLKPDAPPFKNLWFVDAAVPDPTASILIRKRRK